MPSSSEFLPVVYDRLKSFAKARFQQDDSLFGTALVHEAYLRVAEKEDWDSKAHFFGAIRNAMRNAIVDHLRKKSSEKHGGKHRRVDLSNFDFEGPSRLPEIVALSNALDELAEHDARAANIVTLRFFACMTEDEIADELKISKRSVARDWSYARAWLQKAMESTD